MLHILEHFPLHISTILLKAYLQEFLLPSYQEKMTRHTEMQNHSLKGLNQHRMVFPQMETVLEIIRPRNFLKFYHYTNGFNRKTSHYARTDGLCGRRDGNSKKE